MHFWSCTTSIPATLQVAFLCTIHQPVQEQFFMFDHLVLMQRGGSLIYFGPTGPEASALVAYLRGLPDVGPLPACANPADWMLQVIGAGVGHDDGRAAYLTAVFYESNHFEVHLCSDLRLPDLQLQGRWRSKPPAPTGP